MFDTRIRTLASLAKDSESLVDIGSDHAYTVIDAVKNHNVKSAYAVDIALGPLENAKTNIDKFGLNKQIETILSDGFASVSVPFDTAIISGMGGILIQEIIEKELSKVRQASKLILQANNDVPSLRRFLMNNLFEIIDEQIIISSKKYYQIIVCAPVNSLKKLSILDLEFGPILRSNRIELFIKYYQSKLEMLEASLKMANSSDSINALSQSINQLKEVLK